MGFVACLDVVSDRQKTDYSGSLTQLSTFLYVAQLLTRTETVYKTSFCKMVGNGDKDFFWRILWSGSSVRFC